MDKPEVDFDFNKFDPDKFDKQLQAAFKSYQSPPEPNMVSEAKNAVKKINGNKSL